MNDTAASPTADDLAFRQDRLLNVLVHGSVILLSLLVLHLLVPWVVELSGFQSGKLPASFQLVVDLFFGVRQSPLLAVFAFVLFLCFDDQLYSGFYLRVGRRPALAWAFGVFSFIVAALAFCLWASHSFLTGMIPFLSRFL